MTTTAPRPEPLKELATAASTFNGVIMGVLTALVTGGLITTQTGNLVTALYGLIPGGLALAATVLGAYALADAGRAVVTPVSDPMTTIDGRLVPLVPETEPPAAPSGPASPSFTIPPINTY